MTGKNVLDIDMLAQLLTYEPDTGKLFWKPRCVGMFKSESAWKTWTKRFCGKEALCALDGNGYLCGTVLGKKYRAHRVAWALYHLMWPTKNIDHINGDPSDNKITNLRDVSQTENVRNSKLFCTNKSGFVGVRQERSGKWVAEITLNSRNVRIGTFESKVDAVHARKAAGHKNGFHENHGRP